MDKIDKAMKRIKLWQEECKLVGMVMAALTSVFVFVSRLMHVGLSGGGAKSASEPVHHGAGMARTAVGHMDIPSEIPAVAQAPGQDWVLVGSIVALVIILPMVFWYIIKVVGKHRGKSNG